MTSTLATGDPFLEALPDELFQRILQYLNAADLLHLSVTAHTLWAHIGLTNPLKAVPYYIAPILNILPKRCLGVHSKRSRAPKRQGQAPIVSLCHCSYILPKVTVTHKVVSDVLVYRLWKKRLNLRDGGEITRYACKRCTYMKVKQRQKARSKSRKDPIVPNRPCFPYLAKLTEELEEFFTRPSSLVNPKQRTRAARLTAELSSEFLLNDLYLFLRILQGAQG